MVWIGDLEKNPQLIGKLIAVEGRSQSRFGRNVLRLSQCSVEFRLYLAAGLPASLPVFVRLEGKLSRSKDMGYSVGPFQWSQLKGGKAQHGTFVSVWEVKQDGEWKVILDHGVQYKQPARQPAEPMLVEDRGESGGVERAAKRALLVTDDTLGRALETEDPVALYREHTAADFLLLRSDMQPVAGRDEAIKALGTEAPMFASIEMAGAGISKGGDLAFTYGIAKLAKPGGASFDATYVRIWRKGTGDSWDLALELATPLPNPGDKKKS